MPKTLLKLAASLVVLGALFLISDVYAIFERLRGADFGWLFVALSCLTALTFLMARRWQLTAHALDLDLTYPRAVTEYYIAQLLNFALPGGVAGDAARAMRLRKVGDLVRAAQSVMIERLIGQMTLFIMMFLGFGLSLLVPTKLLWPQSILYWLILAIILAAFTVVYARRADNKVARFLATALRLMCKPQQIVLSVLIAVLISTSFYACARATGTVLPIAGLFTLIPLILTSMLIPLSIGGWGWREGAAAALFPIAGALPSAGVAAGIAYGAMILVAALPAAFILFFQSNHTRSPIKATTDA